VRVAVGSVQHLRLSHSDFDFWVDACLRGRDGRRLECDAALKRTDTFLRNLDTRIGRCGWWADQDKPT
jgi:hypothetical protein